MTTCRQIPSMFRKQRISETLLLLLPRVIAEVIVSFLPCEEDIATFLVYPTQPLLVNRQQLQVTQLQGSLKDSLKDFHNFHVQGCLHVIPLTFDLNLNPNKAREDHILHGGLFLYSVWNNTQWFQFRRCSLHEIQLEQQMQNT
jgi:hypothetical protein